MFKFHTVIAVLFVVSHIANVESKCNHGIINKGVSNNDKNAIVKKHNDLRQSIARGEVAGQPRATNMGNLQWDDKLAFEAQKIAETCEFEHKGVKDPRWWWVGQNLGLAMSTTVDQKYDWTGIIQSWFNEHKNYKFSNQFSHDAGHYTQVVWADTKSVGCGATIYQSDDSKYKYHKLYVCNYGPGGNVGGQYPYKT